MTAPHFFAPSVDPETVTLAGDEATHASRVLRIRAGETITIADGSGRVATAIVEEAGKVVRARVTARREAPAPVPTVTVYPAVPKSGKLELVVQKLTELGVDAIVPWFADRTVVRWDAAKAKAHHQRLMAVAFEAAKQSRRARLPDLAEPRHLDAIPKGTVVLHEEEHAARLRDVLPEDATTIGIVIGPEGGLDAAEVERFRASGAVIAGLGDQILRAETASIVAAALALSRYGRLG